MVPSKFPGKHKVAYIFNSSYGVCDLWVSVRFQENPNEPHRYRFAVWHSPNYTRDNWWLTPPGEWDWVRHKNWAPNQAAANGWWQQLTERRQHRTVAAANGCWRGMPALLPTRWRT